MKTVPLLTAAAIFAVSAMAQARKPEEASNPAFLRVRSLAGDWGGSAVHQGQNLPAAASFRVVADGSAVMHDLAPGTPHEMITMFHMDGKDLLATHYCSRHNQPRLRAVPSSDPKVIAFAFQDATNLASPSEGHMTELKLTVVDPDHHIEEWTAVENGKAVTLRFEFHRKKPAAE